MNSFFNQAQQYLFILLGVFIPTSIAATNILIACLSICWILEGKYKEKYKCIKSSKWMLSIFGLISLYILGLFWGDNHANSLWQFQRLALLLLFPVLGTLILHQKTLKKGIISFLITTFISALIAIGINCEIISPLDEYFSFLDYDKFIPAFIIYNYHNVLLAISYAISLYLFLEKKTQYRQILILFIIVYAASIFTEKGRAGQVLFNLTSIFYIVYYNRKSILRIGFLLTLLLSFLFCVYTFTDVYKKRLYVATKIIENNKNLDPYHIKRGKIVLDQRFIFAKESLIRIIERPILGHGTGSFGSIFKKEVKQLSNVKTHITPHNQYLYVWFEIGIFGLALLISIFYYQIRDLFQKKDGIHRVVLPASFMFLMLIDSYFFIFILTAAYIYLFTIYNRYQSE